MADKNRTSNCIVCSNHFDWVINKKTCSEDCRLEQVRRTQKARLRRTLQLDDHGRAKLTCKICSNHFFAEIKSGYKQVYCSDFCRTRARHWRNNAQPLCVIPGCRNKRGYSDGICNSCYYRRKRTGTTDKRVWAYRSINSSGYIAVSDKNHPLSGSKGFVYEHRKVLYDMIGPGPVPCFWCKKDILWGTYPVRSTDLVPDHLDGDKHNNDPKNLVPSCQRCNFMRGSFMRWVDKHKDDPWLWHLYQQARNTEAVCRQTLEDGAPSLLVSAPAVLDARPAL